MTDGQGVEGRWTVRVCACSTATIAEVGPALPTPCEVEGKVRLVPVVPCDVAAVERGARALASEVQRRNGHHGLDNWTFEEVAEWVLRAAGAQHTAAASPKGS